MFYCREIAFGFPKDVSLMAYYYPSFVSFVDILVYLPYSPLITIPMNFWSYPKEVKYYIGEKSELIWQNFFKSWIPVSNV